MISTVNFFDFFSTFRRVEDYDLHRQVYRGKASLLYAASCKFSGLPVALKLYRKHKLSDLNWYQV
jgi:aurora kinase, other